jgi:hypothetical protein
MNPSLAVLIALTVAAVATMSIYPPERCVREKLTWPPLVVFACAVSAIIVLAVGLL